MSHFGKHIASFLTLSDFLRLNFLEEMTLKDIKSLTFDESKFFSNKKSISDIPYIVKLAQSSSDFASMCKKDLYVKLWNDLYSLLGFAVSSFEGKKVTFYTHHNIDSFDLLRGTYFFYLSQQIRAALSIEFSSSEIRFLKEAMRFNSVHAVQRYNTFLYSKVDKGILEEGEDAKKMLLEAINNAKSLLEINGSYAYMLLAEAFYRYALWAKEYDKISVFERALQSAITSCDKASKYLEKSEFSIHNASFGKGLSFSNSFNYDCPDDAKRILEGIKLNTNSPTVS